MNSRVALAVFVLLILTVAVGWFAIPEPTQAASYAPADTVAYYERSPRSADASGPATALILACMIVGAAAIGLIFFRPYTPKGLRHSGAPSVVRRIVPLLVQRARRGLADLHQELEVVLGLLQSVDQKVDRLVRVETRQHAAQLVQHRRLVWAQQ